MGGNWGDLFLWALPFSATIPPFSHAAKRPIGHFEILYAFTVFCEIIITRDKGQLRVPIGSANKMQGDLMLEHRSLGEGERSVPVLRCLPGTRELYEPRMTYVCANVFTFFGLERDGPGWHAQEWRCEVVRV